MGLQPVRRLSEGLLEKEAEYRSMGTIGPLVGGGTILDGQWALPLPKEVLNPNMLGQPHHDYPAIDLVVPSGLPIFAMRSGVVIAVRTYPYNCADAPCGTNTCGTGTTIRDAEGFRWTYCHMTPGTLAVSQGQPVTAGQGLGRVGNTGRSGIAHLHVQIRDDPTSADHCPQPLLKSLYLIGTGVQPASLPTSGCSF